MSWSGLQPTVEIILLAEGLSRPVDFGMAAVVRWGRQAIIPKSLSASSETIPKDLDRYLASRQATSDTPAVGDDTQSM